MMPRDKGYPLKITQANAKATAEKKMTDAKV
jgi:hypothetical protein